MNFCPLVMSETVFCPLVTAEINFCPQLRLILISALLTTWSELLEKLDHFFDILISAEMKNFRKPLGKLENVLKFQISDLQKRVECLRFLRRTTEGAQNRKKRP